MYELQCPSCNKASQYNFTDYLLLCPFCSSTFKFNVETGHKEIFGDHYIVPNLLEAAAIKDLALEWLRRIHHKPGAVDKEFFVVDVQGFSIPLWIVSLEGHTAWKGLVRKQNRNISNHSTNEYLVESGQFRRSYRWAISARANICETWGLTRLHEPTEPISVEWDGFPFDSTFSRGRLMSEEQRSAYEGRHYFEFKYANSLPILGIQVEEQEGLRRARNHVELYHYKLACLNSDYLIDYRTELEVAGIQLIHVPIWKVGYIYKPRSLARHFFRSKEKRMIIDGYARGVLSGELAMVYHDKVMINAYVTALAAVFFFLLGISWHPALLLVAVFALMISLFSVYTSLKRKAAKEEEELQKLSASIGRVASTAQAKAS